MMNTGKRIKTLILAFAVAASMLVPQVSFASVTAKDEEGLPDQPGASAALWKKSFGSTSGETWKNAPTPPAYINGSIYVAAGNRVYKLNAKTGEQEAASDTLGTAPAFGYATQPVTADSDGNIYTTTQQTVSGVTTTKVVRLTSDLSSAAWTSDEMTGQNISPVTCIGGRVYTGTFTNKNGGMYRCIDAASGETKWTVTNDGGFYWCGAASVGGRVIFGSDDGNIYSVSETAEDTSDMKTTDLGDCSVRCAPAVSGGAAYITTKSESGVAKIYKLGVSADGTVSDEKSAPFGDSVNTPVIFDGNIFVGNTSGEVAAFSGSLEKKASVKLDGPVQGRLLVSGDSGSGYSVCACCNAAPGGISLARFSGDLTRAENRGLVYAPAESQYCISPVTEADGVLYYKNDSNTIFAVKKAAPDQTSLRGLKALSVSYQAVRVSWTRRDNVVSYEVYRALSKNGKYTTIKVLPPSASYFTNTGLSCGRPYYYKVRAKLRGGKYTAIGNPVSAVPVVGAPRLNTYAGTARVTLRWTKAYGASGYKVFRSTSKNGKYKYVRTTRSNAWVNSGLARKRVYFYKVRPYRKCGRKLVYGKWSNISYKRTK